MVVAQMPTATREDYENIIARLRASAARRSDDRADGAGHGRWPDATSHHVPGCARSDPGQIVPDPLQSPMLDAFKTWPSVIPEADRAALTVRQRTRTDSRCRPRSRSSTTF